MATERLDGIARSNVSWQRIKQQNTLGVAIRNAREPMTELERGTFSNIWRFQNEVSDHAGNQQVTDEFK
jgi:hypothetical protein